MEDYEGLKELLSEKEKEIEALKEDAEIYREVRENEVERAKQILGSNWDEGYSILSIAGLRKLISSFSIK